MNPRTAVITGAAGGLGQATARQLLADGFDVVAVTRDARSAQAARQALAAHAPGRTVHALHTDLVDRAGLRALGARLRDLVGHVDVLINNAGAAFASYAETDDGVERTHALNLLAPLHLTHVLVDADLLAPTARVISISSDLVSRGRIDAHDPDVTGTSWRTKFPQLNVYGSAKLLGILATAALADRLPADMSAYSATPGVIKTGFNAKSGGLLKAVAAVSGLFAQAPDKAARTPVLLATSGITPTPNGGFFAKGAPADPPKPARDPVLAATVYERCVRELGVSALPPRANAELS
jgi:NAD(P)-dependent dehydrogenase (short-subunit alcohol dehydrogenase family)